MITIKNDFNFKDPCKTGVTYRVWTKEPGDLEGKCVATAVNVVRSSGMDLLTDRKGGTYPSYHLKEYLPAGILRDEAQSIRDMIGLTMADEGSNVEQKPLGCALNPETYALAKALYDLAAGLTIEGRVLGKPVTDIVIRDIRFSPEQFTKEELASLRKENCVPSEHVVLQLTTNLYSR